MNINKWLNALIIIWNGLRWRTHWARRSGSCQLWWRISRNPSGQTRCCSTPTRRASTPMWSGGWAATSRYFFFKLLLTDFFSSVFIDRFKLSNQYIRVATWRWANNIWIRTFGPPKKFFSDNGGEFNFVLCAYQWTLQEDPQQPRGEGAGQQPQGRAYI